MDPTSTSRPSPSKFTLHPVRPSDATSIARIFQSAFAHDHIMRHFYPHTPEDLKWEQDLKFFARLIEQCSEGNAGGGRMTKVVEGEGEGGKIVGFSKWDYPYTLTAEQEEERKRKQMEEKLKKCVRGSNEGLMREFFEQLTRGRERWLVGGRMFFLHMLTVDPAYQRRGLGSMLIRPGLEAADKAGAKTYIEATPDGLELYLKYGWEPVDEMVIDMEKFGAGNGVERMPFLIREAGAGKKFVRDGSGEEGG